MENKKTRKQENKKNDQGVTYRAPMELKMAYVILE